MSTSGNQSGDKLLWLAAGVIVLMGASWLLIEAPWSTDDAANLEDLATAGSQTPARPETPPPADAAAADPLLMARMALDAGMLTEPDQYSAWTLYGSAVEADPSNAAARRGLEEVADRLLQQGTSALEQGRYQDATSITDRIRERLPDHQGAEELAAAIRTATTPREPEPRPAADSAARVEPGPQPDDRIPELHTAFREAMARNDVLRPEGSSAIDVVSEMLATAPLHELTAGARDLLVTEMLDRSRQSIEALDEAAARTWIDAARPIAADDALIAEAEHHLNQFLIETETQKILPASELNRTLSKTPEYPRVPAERGIEGWVEVEFTVATDGSTQDINVIDASHERYFREEAIAAISEWRYEPVVFMDQAIPKRTYTRLVFQID